MTLHVHIERLLLDGLAVDALARPALQAAIEAELGRLLAAGGLSPALETGGSVARVTGGVVRMPAGGGPAEIGSAIAGGVFTGIGGGPDRD